MSPARRSTYHPPPLLPPAPSLATLPLSLLPVGVDRRREGDDVTGGEIKRGEDEKRGEKRERERESRGGTEDR